MDFRSPVESLLQAARSHEASGAWSDALALLREHADAARKHPELATLRGAAELHTGHPREAHHWLQTTLPIIERSGDRRALRKAMNQLGVAEIELGALDSAERMFGRALELARVDGDDLLVAQATNNMGAVANIRGRRDEALALYQLAIPAYQRLGNVAGLAQSFHNMAISFRHLGQLDTAGEYETRAIRYAIECSNASLLALAWLERAELLLESGDPALAEVGAQRAASQFEKLPNPIRQADALRVVGSARLALGRVADAASSLERALDLARAHESRLVEAETLRARAACFLQENDLASARGEIAMAIAIFGDLGAEEQRNEAIEWARSAWPSN